MPLTNLLYYEDPYIKQFETTLIRQERDEAGTYVVLEETAFYPTGGGQPCDTGYLNEREVVNVIKTQSGEVHHYLNEPLSEGTTVIQGMLNWQRRFDHMQQHAAQHVVSAVFAEELGYETVSFHLGSQTATIDLAVKELSEEEIRRVETSVNHIIFSNKAINVMWLKPEEISEYPLRKVPEVDGSLRMVWINGIDYNACGGTHPRYTAEIGAVKLLSWEKHRGHVRLTFIAGHRVIDTFNQMYDSSKQAALQLDGGIDELSQKAANIVDQKAALEKALKDVKRQLLDRETKDIQSRKETMNGVPVYTGSFLNHDIKDLQYLSSKLTEWDVEATVLLTAKKGNHLHVLTAKGDEQAYLEMQKILKYGLDLFDGKGGGRANRAQGGGQTDLAAEGLLQYMLEHIKEELAKVTAY